MIICECTDEKDGEINEKRNINDEKMKRALFFASVHDARTKPDMNLFREVIGNTVNNLKKKYSWCGTNWPKEMACDHCGDGRSEEKSSNESEDINSDCKMDFVDFNNVSKDIALQCDVEDRRTMFSQCGQKRLGTLDIDGMSGECSPCKKYKTR